MTKRDRVPKFKRVAGGDYETAGGRFRLYQLVDVRPPAWNVEEQIRDDLGRWIDWYSNLIVDGAATRRDALALFANWFCNEKEER